ncbi:MAG: spondin domain-containing protein [Geitlerinemataceae cyanobacterium]
MEKTLAVVFENLAPTAGNSITPVWVGIHNGQFDNYNLGEAVTPGFERLAEDGNTAPVSAEFAASGFGAVDATLGGAPIAPGNVAWGAFTVNSSDPNAQYLNYASMILPSNDAWIANGNPQAIDLFDADGNFTAIERIVSGSTVVDAGTEVNDEVPANTAFFGQSAPDTGVVENGVVTRHPGFLDASTGGILADSRFSNADFRRYDALRISITELTAGDAAANALTGSDAVDVTVGLDGDDTIAGGNSADVLVGNTGNDTISGGAGADLIRGGRGNDAIDGGIDDDIIWGDIGSDTLTGGAGEDIFLLRSGDGSDTITDFFVGIDTIGLSGGLAFSDLTLGDSAGGATLTVNSSSELLATLTGVTASQLSSANFTSSF